MAEELKFNLLADERGAVGGFQRTGRAAAAASDDVLALAKRLDEIGKKSAQARVGLAGDKDALAQLDRLDMKLLTTGRKVVDPKVSLDGAARASLEISGLDVQLDKLAAKSAGTEAAVGAGGLSGPSGIGALIGAGVVLSPVLTTLAFGLGGFGAAAIGVAKPIADAASKTGGLAKNMADLTPEQQSVARGLLGLERQFGQFEKALAPDVMGVFNQGLSLAGHVMHDVEPVAAATGKALGAVLGRVDAEFQSGQWQDFFGFMARTAGPDIKLVGDVLISLTKDIPPLLESLQPAARGLLTLADDSLKLFGALEKVHLAVPLVGAALGFMVGGPVGAAVGALAGLAEQAFTTGHGIDSAVHPTVRLGGALYAATPQFARFGASAEEAAGKTGKSGDSMKTAAGHAYTEAQQLKAVSKAITDVMNAETTALDKQTAYANSLVAAANDAATLAAKLKISGDRIGLHTQAQRDSFGAANTYISDLEDQATQAIHSGHGVDAAIRAIRNGLPVLENAKTKNRAYWQEVRTLEGWLAKLKTETVRIDVNAKGIWHVAPGGGLPGGTAGGPFAAGGRVTGGIAGRDSVVAALMPGEVVVPTSMVNSGAVDHLRGRLPGFAAGGVVGSYADGIPGLDRWMHRENTATLSAVAAATAKATAAALNSVFGGGTGRQVARYALGYNGGTAFPYVLGGASPQGWDCSGFTAWVYEHFGLMPGHQGSRFGTSESQAAWVKRTPRPEVGGLAFFNDGVFANPGHVGIITGPGTYISAHSPQTGTTNSPMSGAVMFGIPPGRTIAGFESGSPQGGGKPLPGGGSSAANRAVGLQEASQFGWGSGPSWRDLDLLWNKESGWRNLAQNPTSTAYGIAQFLDSTWATVGGHKTSNPGLQILYGLRYIQRRYGNPETAWAHEVAFNSYDGGGVLPENVAGVGMRSGQGYQLHAGETVSRGGGSTFNITITLPPGSSREHGRQIVDAIVHYERAAGSGWRS